VDAKVVEPRTGCHRIAQAQLRQDRSRKFLRSERFRMRRRQRGEELFGATRAFSVGSEQPNLS
jgi:hypothetical protein